jgi:hypothetical protein
MAGVPTSDDDDRSLWDIARPSVLGGVDLKDVGGELRGKVGNAWRLEWTGRDDDLVGLDRPVVESEYKAVALRRQKSDGAVELDGEGECLSVVLEVAHDFVARRRVPPTKPPSTTGADRQDCRLNGG